MGHQFANPNRNFPCCPGTEVVPEGPFEASSPINQDLSWVSGLTISYFLDWNHDHEQFVTHLMTNICFGIPVLMLVGGMCCYQLRETHLAAHHEEHQALLQASDALGDDGEPETQRGQRALCITSWVFVTLTTVGAVGLLSVTDSMGGVAHEIH